MSASDPSEHDRQISTSAPGAVHTGALVLGLLVVAAFCGWYLVVGERPADTTPLPVIQKPLIPPSTTDTSSELPGHEHYTVLSPGTDQVPVSKTP